jgi:uncharacterized protein YkwD
MSMLRTLLSLALVAILALSCTPAAPTASFGSWTPPIKATPEIKALEHEMHQRVNKDRAGAGLPVLKYDERLADIARAHSLDMRDHSFFAHESPTTGVLEDRIVAAGYLALEMRENLALAPDVQRAEDNLLKSPGHKKNIMATAITHIGVGIVRGDSSGDDRALMFTQVFATPTELDGPDQAVNKVRTMLNAARSKAGLAAFAPHDMLQELADRYIDDIPDDVAPSAVDDVADRVSGALNEHQGHGLAGISVVAQPIFSAAEFPLPGGVDDPKLRHIGMAARKATDDKGRPRVKILVLLGRAK